MIEYVTIDGDMLDALCYRIYGFVDGSIQTVLSQNPGLSAQGEVYGPGIRILFPEVSESNVQELRVWD